MKVMMSDTSEELKEAERGHAFVRAPSLYNGSHQFALLIVENQLRTHEIGSGFPAASVRTVAKGAVYAVQLFAVSDDSRIGQCAGGITRRRPASTLLRRACIAPPRLLRGSRRVPLRSRRHGHVERNCQTRDSECEICVAMLPSPSAEKIPAVKPNDDAKNLIERKHDRLGRPIPRQTRASANKMPSTHCGCGRVRPIPRESPFGTRRIEK